MTPEQFEELVAEEFPRAVPEQFHAHIRNLVFLIEDEPDAATRAEEGLSAEETLLGLYRGVPYTARGEGYGIGATLPDTITLYRLPLIEEAALLRQKHKYSEEASLRQAIRDTIWHEVAHHFGMDEHTVRAREDKRENPL